MGLTHLQSEALLTAAEESISRIVRNGLDRHPSYILAAYMASGT